METNHIINQPDFPRHKDNPILHQAIGRIWRQTPHGLEDNTPIFPEKEYLAAKIYPRIVAGQVLTARSICDHECIFSITILKVSGTMATFKDDTGKIRRSKIRHYRDESSEYEYLRPDSYSMAPIYRAKFSEQDYIDKENKLLKKYEQT